MEHEVHVPVPADRLRVALADPARVARAVPGLQQDAGTEPVAGRLKLRIGGHSITYRGALRVTARDGDAFAVEGDATESRGSGTVKLALTARLRDADGGTTVAFTGSATADGRVADLPADAVRSAVTRLLNRCVENLAAQPSADPLQPLATEDFAPGPNPDFEASPDADDIPRPATPPGPPSAESAVAEDDVTDGGATDGGATADDATDGSAAEVSPAEGGAADDGADADADDGDGGDADERVSVFDAEVPPSSLDPAGGEPVEAAHARRTMIGRSAEEVDHAPPRGRYAPVPAPQTVANGATLRWVAPAAALVVASAIVVGRVLRKRR